MNEGIKASIGFLAAGNVHFSCRGVMLRLDREPDQKLSFDEALARAREHLARHLTPAAALPAGEDLEALTFAGQAARLAIAVQRIAGLENSDVPGWREFEADDLLAAFACRDRATAQAAAALALHILTDGRTSESDRLVQGLLAAAKPWTLPLAKAAASRGIPCEVAVPGDRPFLALGQGKKRRLFWRNFTPATSHVATVLSTRKDLATRLLRDAGLPAPRNVVVQDAATAVRAAEAFGYPVVVKPAAADYARGVSTSIHNAEHVREAFVRAAEWGPVLVEQQIEGDQHRLTVIHGRCLRVRRSRSPHVVGDGASTISELVEAVNVTRTEVLSSAGMKIKLDEAALQVLRRQGLTRASIPASGQVVMLRDNSNLYSGATSEVVTDVAHPDVLRLAVQAASLFGIDVAGIDYLTTDITRPPAETGGAICEVNVTPGFVDPEELLPDHLAAFFPEGDDGRVPTICLIGPQKTRGLLADGLAALLGPNVARTDDARFWGESDDGKRTALPRRTAATLADPLAAAALIAGTSDEAMATGLGLDRLSLAVFMPGAARDSVVAALRIATDAVMPVSIFTAMENHPLLAERRIWIAGEVAPSASGRCVGVVRQVDPGSIEVRPHRSSPWLVSGASASDEAVMLAAAGAALGLPSSRISECLRLLEARRFPPHNMPEYSDLDGLEV